MNNLIQRLREGSGADRELEQGFINGVVYAAGFVTHWYDLPTIAEEMLTACGIESKRQLRKSGASKIDIDYALAAVPSRAPRRAPSRRALAQEKQDGR